MKIYHIYMQGHVYDTKEELFNKHRSLSIVNIRKNWEQNICYYHYQKNRTIDNLILLAALKEEYCILISALSEYDHLPLQITQLINQENKGSIQNLDVNDNTIKQSIYNRLNEIEKIISTNYE